MIDWKILKSGPTKEEIHGGMTAQDVRDTQDEMWRVDSQMRQMIDGLTLDQRQKLNEKIRSYCDDCKLANIQGEKY